MALFIIIVLLLCLVFAIKPARELFLDIIGLAFGSAMVLGVIGLVLLLILIFFGGLSAYVEQTNTPWSSVFAVGGVFLGIFILFVIAGSIYERLKKKRIKTRFKKKLADQEKNTIIEKLSEAARLPNKFVEIEKEKGNQNPPKATPSKIDKNERIEFKREKVERETPPNYSNFKKYNQSQSSKESAFNLSGMVEIIFILSLVAILGYWVLFE
jgi:hypothetical protein